MGLESLNPVVGGTVLRRAAMQSPNFARGSAGWNIGQDGSAEFNNVVIRDGQVISGTELFYDGAGNLIASVSAVSGTDSLGHNFVSGMAVYDPVTGNVTQLDAGLLNVTSSSAGGLGRLLWIAASLSSIGGASRNIAEITAVDTSTLQTIVDVIAPTGTKNGAVVIFGWEPTAAVVLPVSLVLAAAGSGLAIKEGTNARMGTGTLASGTATIANTSVTANTRVFITMRTHGPNSGFVSVSVNAGVGFTVSSSNASDGNTFNWLLIEPA